MANFIDKDQLDWLSRNFQENIAQKQDESLHEFFTIAYKLGYQQAVRDYNQTGTYNPDNLLMKEEE